MNVRRALIEFLIVLLGVLGALLVEDFRDWRNDRQWETHALQGLRSDLARDLDELDQVSRSAMRRVGAGRAMVRLAGDTTTSALFGGQSGARLDADELQDALAGGDTLSLGMAVRFLADFNNFDFSTVTYDELVATGRLGVIRDSDLRRAVATYYEDAVHVVGFDDSTRRVIDRFRDYVVEAGIYPGDATLLDPRALRDAVRSDPRIEAAARANASRSRAYAGFAASLARSGAQLIEMIDDALRDEESAS